ncbi:Tyrosyl-DNA phosphodiesterase 1 [Zancudomyces culisetae]|uniref:Tyrosyl-DNA phosphodiesterase 1 n=1 Tax=Zancudomyces culisetae TaxID=1213189 RepID=A0A1R1PTR2_ZANCU|nr:Tyrosyl-DNA phosphodiesterase 1 [Zancudomyces culisetae]|eukprot:OMH84334.1 Tyrosyl-DNA phosphodiesterase 1 [Zancudomyces culisetae]
MSRKREIITIIDSDEEGSQKRQNLCGQDNQRIKDTSRKRLSYSKGRVFLVKLGPFTALENSVSFEELVVGHGSEKIKKAVMTTFVLDYEWLRGKLGNNVNLCLVINFEKDKDYKVEVKRLDENTVIVAPPQTKSRFGIFHPKIMVLWFETFVRIVISSANLIALDWEVMQNILFVQDFPLLTEKTEKKDVSEFGCDIIQFFEAIKVPEQVLEAIEKIDFSTAKYRALASIPGKFPINEAKYGYLGLSKALSEKNFSGEVEYAFTHCSSVGFIDNEWYMELCSKLFSGFAFKILYPTTNMVSDSLLGEESVCSLFFSKHAYLNRNFPKKILYSYKATSKGALSHCKLLFCRFKGQNKGWLYLGSHNMSKAAWGKSTRGSLSQFEIGNTEIGALLPVTYIENKPYLAEDFVKFEALSEIPLPFELDFKPYSTADVPWTT